MKTAIVTGTSTGIGRAIALVLAREGMKVLLMARTRNRLEETKQLIEQEKGNTEIFVADLSNVDSINTLISDIKGKYKSIDVLVNVAGIWHGDDEVFAGKDFDTFSQKVILDTYSVGTIAPTLLCIEESN
ncbi:MAG: SDR family NAD(P)-dependent oxidoreductase [Patescibacteria group bacterium]